MSRTSQNDHDLIGAHVSARGGVCNVFDRADEIGASAVAFFSKNNNRWAASPLGEEECATFRERRRASGAPLMIHAAYLINLAATDEGILERSIAGLEDELRRAAKLGAESLVIHPGAHMGAGVTKGIDRIARALDEVHRRLPELGTKTLLETSAGQGSSLCCTFEEIGRILRLVDDPSRVGVCVDTCHIFAAGYDFSTPGGWSAIVDEMAEQIGLDRVEAFHLNDSKRELGSRVDRHEHIGEGKIGLDPFGQILNDSRFREIPKVIETPKTVPVESDLENLRRLRSLTGPLGRRPPL